MRKLTAEWVQKAESDYQLAAKLGQGKDRFYDQLCFHCQQASEKFLKGLLEELGHSIPRTHVLHDLQSLLLPAYPTLRPMQRGMKFLTRFAVATRYPGDTATKRQAKSALRWAKTIRKAVYTHLGAKAPKASRGKV
jgi:HEPN domain-containing protein